ncbi:glycoside hydrolase family 3 protein [Glaciecola sp. 1036]|uniref:glycoside hydrolase family 3 protein n=1 Tax=Alteromonadaceae TaxID=72275 RepID=UPI003D03A12E
MRIKVFFFVITVLSILTGCVTPYKPDETLEKMVAQKIMIDVRYFCSQPTNACRESVTELPPELADLIAETGIGGVILFANNLENNAQIIQLNQQLQRAALAGGTSELFIAVDQEGGRVDRLPEGTKFAGSMAIGATEREYGDYFAIETGKIIGKELSILGFNVNFAPTVDVNVNPDNPVINVRSFGENPEVVAKLGSAQLNAMQAQGVIAALKHFPGHGDTNVDSHTGLPRVEHSREQVDAIDLLPFRYAIENGNPGMIMTAHIQYPNLDNATFTAKDGEQTIVPATMSKVILTDVLRGELNYQGVVVTDALNMAGIADYYKPVDAVIRTFAAGSDIALMPMAIRSPEDIATFKNLIKKVAHAVQLGKLDYAQLFASVERIKQLKQDYPLTPASDPTHTHFAESVVGSKQHQELAQQLADASVVSIKGALPLDITKQKVRLVMPDARKCLALLSALYQSFPEADLHCDSLAGSTITSLPMQIQTSENEDIVIAGLISPRQSMAELGGMDDLRSWRDRPDSDLAKARLLTLLKDAKQAGKTTVLLSLRTPYDIGEFEQYADVILSSFSYGVQEIKYVDKQGNLITQVQGPIFKSIAKVLAGQLIATGNLPVSAK